MRKLFIVACLVLASSLSFADDGMSIEVGSKAFTEGYVLGELAAQVLESRAGRSVTRKFGLGNTGVVFEALKKGDIDVYPEYTGTISEAILKDPSIRDIETLRRRMKNLGFEVSEPLGFDNTYALAVTSEFANAHGLRRISDLRSVRAELRAAFSHEFVNREDGLPNLQKAYRLDLGSQRQSLEHSLAYEAIDQRKVDLIDVYSTDARIEQSRLVVLEDDRGYFPKYQAVFIARKDFVETHPDAWIALDGLAGSIDENAMRKLNAGVELEKKSFARVVAEFIDVGADGEAYAGPTIAQRVWQRTKEHSFLVGVTLLLSVFTGLPLGILIARHRRSGQALLLLSSIIQTIPSLALLSLLIPIFGIGTKPALVALFLYSLLPILLNTYVGLQSIDPKLLETARALGLSPLRTLFEIELPLASRSILAGIKTSTVIGIGTATLAALVGAGGYGAPIVSGLAINDVPTILIGAVPAAAMALLAHFVFGLVTNLIVPRGLNR